MKDSITGAKPAGNIHPSVPRGNVCPEREKQWAAQLAASRRKNSSDVEDRFHPVDKSTGELLPWSGEQAPADVVKRGKIARARWGREQAQIFRYQASDPGVLLKRLYLADEAEKRSKAFVDVFGVNGFTEKKYRSLSVSAQVWNICNLGLMFAMSLKSLSALRMFL